MSADWSRRVALEEAGGEQAAAAAAALLDGGSDSGTGTGTWTLVWFSVHRLGNDASGPRAAPNDGPLPFKFELD